MQAKFALADIDPAWSPRADRIAFSSNRDARDGNHDLYVMNADGSNVRRLTHIRSSINGRSLIVRSPTESR